MRCALWILLSLTISCGKPIETYQKLITDHGYIPYTTPLQYAGTGTLLGGAPDQLALISGPQTCFPDEADGQPTHLRHLDESTLPSYQREMFFEQDLYARLFEILQAGAPSIRAGFNIVAAERLSLSFEGVKVEYMDSVYLSEFYRSGFMSETCKDYLDQVGFVIQAIKVDAMEFSFYRKDGGRILLDVENIEQFLDIGTDIEWEIIEETKFVIETPKYIGYQLGSLRREDDAMVLHRANKIHNNRFVFEPIYVFDGLDQPEAEGFEMENESSFLIPLQHLPNSHFLYYRAWPFVPY